MLFWLLSPVFFLLILFKSFYALMLPLILFFTLWSRMVSTFANKHLQGGDSQNQSAGRQRLLTWTTLCHELCLLLGREPKKTHHRYTCWCVVLPWGTLHCAPPVQTRISSLLIWAVASFPPLHLPTVSHSRLPSPWTIFLKWVSDHILVLWKITVTPCLCQVLHIPELKIWPK